MRFPNRLFGSCALSLAAFLAIGTGPLSAASQVNIKVDNGGAPAVAPAPGPDTAALMQKSRQEAAARAAKARQDSLAMAAKAHQDSLNLAGKAQRDSQALAESQRRLEIEISRRSDMEKQLLTTGLLVLDAVYFETGRTAISINSKPYLTMLAKMLTKYPKLQIEVDGHTDNVGSDAYNLNLSQGRALAVRNYLVSQAPELDSRLTAKGYGESAPKADNATADGRKFNRRTELQVLNKTALREYNEPSRLGGTAPVPADHAAGSGEGVPAN
jgi:outer membrane protein OmpA-like peptidoglycan-associated protein